jgi:hypothetical protein
MRKSWIYALILLSLYSCGSYTLQTANKGSRIQSILAVTQAGDTVSVPYKDFIRERYDNYTRFNYNNNNWYWNNWGYLNDWRWNNWSWNNNYWNNTPFYNGPRVRQLPKPKTRPRPRTTPGVIPKPKEDRVRINIGRRNETNTNNPRRPQQTQSRDNGRGSRLREIVPSQPTRSRQPRAVQPRQIRRGQGSPVLQQSRGSQSTGGEGRTSSGRKQN